MKNVLKAGIAVVAAVSLLTGCGGGGGTSTTSLTKGSKPTSTTKARVETLFSGSVRSLTQAGFQTATAATSANAGAVAPALTSATAGTATLGTSSGSSSNAGIGIPLVGAFLKSIEAPTTSRAKRIVRRNGRDVAVGVEVPPSGTTGVAPSNDFYFDYFLGLWVSVTNTSTQSTFLLYSDQAETEPAGSIVTTWPASDTVFPQTFTSTYSFTAGYLAGSSGNSTQTTNADGSSTSNYSDTYGDGSSDSGSSTFTSTGASTWTSKSIAQDGTWTTFQGTFNSDGSGTTSSTMSDGYAANYAFNADGSGSGTITGPDPGLPATVKWDVYGDTTITFADGSAIYYPGWSSTGGAPIPVTSTTGTTTGSSGSSGGSSGSTGTTVSTPPTATSPPAAIGI